MSSEGEVADEYVNFDFAIMAVFATYVFDVSTQFGVEREKLQTSDCWSKDEKRLNEALKGVRSSMFWAVSLWLILIIATAIGISLPTRALDERMVWILEGLSLLFAAVLVGHLSFAIVTWSGTYFKIWDPPEGEESRTLKEVKFKARWSYHRIFGRYFFFLMPFFQGANALKIPLSMIAGIGGGLFADFGVYLARRKKKRFKRCIVISFITLFVGGSSVLVADGIYFIAKVWGQYDNPARDVWTISALLVSMFVEAMLHVCRWWISQKKFKSEDAAAAAVSTQAHRPRMATSLVFERLKRRKTTENRGKTSGNERNEIIEALGDESDDDGGSSSSEGTDSVDAEPEAVGDKAATESPTPPDTESEAPLAKDGSEPDPEAAVGSETDPGAADAPADESKVDQNEEEQYYETPSYCQMFRSYWTCCGCVRGDGRTRKEKFWSFLYWLVWFALVGLSLYLVIVNLGATAQQEHAREKLPYVARVLYDTMDEGPVCAFDNKGEDSNITTFDDKDAAHAAGFLVLHCGACAACSDWHNLRQEYATRHYLAKESARCAKKSLFGGRQAVLDCLKLPPIDFQGQCAECWVDDILCTKDFCAIIFLQSVIINTAANFAVGEDTITSAACEEAHCEAGNPGDFVYCSGATRRRMNVTNNIQRHGGQTGRYGDERLSYMFNQFTLSKDSAVEHLLVPFKK